MKNKCHNSSRSKQWRIFIKICPLCEFWFAHQICQLFLKKGENFKQWLFSIVSCNLMGFFKRNMILNMILSETLTLSLHKNLWKHSIVQKQHQRRWSTESFIFAWYVFRMNAKLLRTSWSNRKQPGSSDDAMHFGIKIGLLFKNPPNLHES